MWPKNDHRHHTRSPPPIARSFALGNNLAGPNVGGPVGKLVELGFEKCARVPVEITGRSIRRIDSQGNERGKSIARHNTMSK